MSKNFKNIFLGLFSAFGLIVFAGIISQLIAGSLGERDFCENIISKKYPSPSGVLELAVEFKNCSQTGATTTVLLYEASNPSTSAVLIYAEEKKNTQGAFPVPIQATWVATNTLEIYLPPEHIPKYTRSDTYGAYIEYRAIGG